MYRFCVNILYLDNDVAMLHKTLASIQGQQYDKAVVNILANSKPDVGNYNAHIVTISSLNEMPHKLYDLIDTADADLFIMAHSGDTFFTHAFQSASDIFSMFNQIEWLTCIETIKPLQGFNVIQGNTSVRRWNSRIFRRNMYQNHARYIPTAGTVWHSKLWNKVKHKVNFVSGTFAHNDLWDAFLPVALPYACDVYFSSKAYKVPAATVPVRSPAVETVLTEKWWVNRFLEFMYLNNVPYLRAYYRYANGFAQVIRFDHKTQSYFLSDY